MKKTGIVLMLMVAISLFNLSAINAQDAGRDFYNYPYKARNSGSFDHKTNLVSLGFGVPNALRFNNGVGFGPLYVKYQHGVLDEVGVGAELGFATSRSKRSGKVYRRSAFNLGVLGYYHFNKFIPLDKLDVYVGLGVGTQIINYSNDFGVQDRSAEASPIFMSRLGARWYFTPGFAAYLEGGYDNLSSVNLGVSFRF